MNEILLYNYQFKEHQTHLDRICRTGSAIAEQINREKQKYSNRSAFQNYLSTHTLLYDLLLAFPLNNYRLLLFNYYILLSISLLFSLPLAVTCRLSTGCFLLFYYYRCPFVCLYYIYSFIYIIYIYIYHINYYYKYICVCCRYFAVLVRINRLRGSKGERYRYQREYS